MSQQSVEYSDDDNVNDILGGSGPSLAATNRKGGPDLTETRGGKANVSRRKNESRTERPYEKGEVHERDESKIQRGKVVIPSEKNDANIGNIPDLSNVQNSQATDATVDKVSWKERLCDKLPPIIVIFAITVAFFTHVYPTLYPKVECVGNFQEQNEFREKFSQRLASVETSMQKIKQIKFRLEGIEEKIQKLDLVVYKNDIVDLVGKDDLDNLVRDIKTDLLGLVDVNKEETKKVFQDEVLNLKTEVDVKVRDINENQERKSQYLEKKNAEMVTEMSRLQSNVETLKEEFGEQSVSQDKTNDEVAMQLSQYKEILYHLKPSEEKHGNIMKHIATETTVLKSETEDIKGNLFDKESLTAVIMLITILLVLVIIYIVANRDTHRYDNRNVDVEHQQSHDGVYQKPSSYSTAGKILSQVRANPRLERKLCVLSFYEETHPLHMRMTQSVTQQLNQELVEFILRRHEDILEIPPVFLYFLFVDFNETNVILEDPTLGLGDLRLTTVQVIQKMNGRIVILYVRDANSRQLDSRKLYNKNLASVTTQRELSALNRISHFISSYDSLTDFQKAHLRLIVENELEGR